MTKRLINALSTLLNIRPGERRRLLVLYLILFTFSNGVTWGGSIAEAAFIHQPGLGVPALPLIIIGDALVSVLAIIVYTAFVDRIPNDRLLVGLLVGFAISIGGGRLLMALEMPTLSYFLLFIIARASDSIFLLHWWTYVSEFYDIRAFKRLAPVILSAKTLGIMTSGATLPLLNRFLSPGDIIFLWMGTLLLMIALCFGMPFFLKAGASAERRVYRGEKRESFVQNIREGYRYVRNSNYLRSFALGSLALAIGAALFQSMSSAVVQATYPDQTGYANFLGVMNTVGGLITFPLQLFLMNRIINRIGVGNAMMLYPVSMGISSAALIFLPPQVLNAALGVLNRSVLRLAFRAPVMGLVYNVVPQKVRGRARAFVSGLVEPLGAVIGSLFLLLIAVPPIVGIALALCVGVYIAATLITRRLYSPTLVETLHDEEYSATLDADAVLTADPQLIQRLKTELPLSKTPESAFFNTRLLLQIHPNEGRTAAGEALAVFQDDPEIQLAILNALIAAQALTPALYLRFIAHEDERLRTAGVDGLEEMQTLSTEDFANIHQRLLEEGNPELQARLIPLVIRSNTLKHTEDAHSLLRELLYSDDLEQVIQGLNVATHIHDRGYLSYIVTLLAHSEDRVRLGAVEAVAAFVRQGVDVPLTLNQLDDLQHDPIERIREVALSILSSVNTALLLNGFKDPSPQVQKKTVEVLVEMGKGAVPMLMQAVNDADLQTRKLASAALCRIQPRRYAPLVEKQILREMEAIHHNYRQLFALRGHQKSAGVRILSTTLREENGRYVDDIFYLLTAVGSVSTAGTIREALESNTAPMRASAIEALEGLVSSQTAQTISALFDGQTLLNQQLNGVKPLTAEAALHELLSDPDDSWLRASAVYALADLEGVFRPKEREVLLKRALRDPAMDVRQAAQAAQRKLSRSYRQKGDDEMISLIERVMFLKGVAIFESIPLEPLKAIAAVCEGEFYKANTVIFQQGEESGGMYVVMSGEVAIEVRGPIRLATLGVNQYFGEMSLFNNRPRSASARALQDTELLKLSRVSFIRLVRQFPDMSLTLLDVLSQRLAEVNEQLAEK